MATLELNGMQMAESTGTKADGAAGAAAGMWGRGWGRAWGRVSKNPGRFAGRAVLVAWAGFWTWFIGASILSEGRTAVLPGGGMLLAAWALTFAGFRWPRAGAVALLGAAGFTLWFFHYPGVWAIMALPLAVAGVLIPWERR